MVKCLASVALLAVTHGVRMVKRQQQLPLDGSRIAVSNESVFAGMVVTLGDSYSSGCGIHKHGRDYDEEYGAQVSYQGVSYKFTPNSDGKCWREKDTTPGPRWAKEVGKFATVLACKGARIYQVQRQFDYLLARYPESYRGKFEKSVITITGGGNDLQNADKEYWPDIVKRCLLEVNLLRGCNENSKNHPSNWKKVEEKLVGLYKNVANAVKDAAPRYRPQIRVMGYPRMFRPSGGKCKGVNGISNDEGKWADRQVDKLNEVIQRAVSNVTSYVRTTYGKFVNMRYVDVAGEVTKGACADKDIRQINNVNFSLDGVVSSASFHPNQRGYNGYFRALNATLSRL